MPWLDPLLVSAEHPPNPAPTSGRSADVVVQTVIDQDEIPNELGVGGNLELESIFHRTYARHCMNCRANTAEPLREQPSLAWIASFEDLFDSPPHCAGGPCIGNSIIIYFDIHAEMPFDA
jgi:hypothetical protein